MPFDTLSKAKAKEYKSLSHKKIRDELGLFIAEGTKCVIDLLDTFHLERLICTTAWAHENEVYVEKFADKVLLSDKRGIEIVSSLNSLPEVIAIFEKPFAENRVDKLDRDKLYLLLDGIQDPGNIGTIIRTCDWFGVYDIFASKTTVDVYNPKVVQATMGSLARVRVRYLDLAILIEENRGMNVMGTLLNGIPINELNGEGKGFLIMGNEGKGISEELKNLIHKRITIPPVNPAAHPDSLNVAIATAICLSKMTLKK